LGGKLIEIDNVKMTAISYQMNKRPIKEDYHKIIQALTRKQITQKKLVVYEQDKKVIKLGTDLHKQLVNMTNGECKFKTRIENRRYWNVCVLTNTSVIWVTSITDEDEKGKFKNFLVMKEVFEETKHGFYPINIEVKPQLTIKRREVHTEQTMQFIWEQYVSQRIYLRKMHAIITENALLYVPTSQKTYKELKELHIQYTHLIQMLQYTTLQEQMNQYRSEHPSDASYILNNTLVIVSHYAQLKYKCTYKKEVLVFVLKRVAGLKTEWIPVLEKTKLDEYIIKITWKKEVLTKMVLQDQHNAKKLQKLQSQSNITSAEKTKWNHLEKLQKNMNATFNEINAVKRKTSRKYGKMTYNQVLPHAWTLALCQQLNIIEVKWLKDMKAYDLHTGRMINKREKPKAGVYLKNPKLIYEYFGDQVIVLNHSQAVDVTSLNFTTHIFERIQVPDYLKPSTMKSDEIQMKYLLMESRYLSGMVTRSEIDNLKQYVDTGFKEINTRLQQDENLMWNELDSYGGGGIFNGIGDVFEKIGSGLGDLTKDIFHGAGDLIKQGGDVVNKIAKTAFKGTKGLIKAGGNAIGGILQKLEMPLIIGGAVIAGIVMIIIIMKVIITKKATQEF